MISLKVAMQIVYAQHAHYESIHGTKACGCFVDAHFDQIRDWVSESVEGGYYSVKESDQEWYQDAPYTCVKRAFEHILPEHVKVVVVGHGNKSQPPRVIVGTYREME